MISIEIKKGDLFKALNKTDIFLHSNNAAGRWGSGIAKIFATKCPDSYRQHQEIKNLCGMGYVLEDKNGYKVGCLITSKGYGQQTDHPSLIVKHTYQACENLFNSLVEKGLTEVTIHSPKINAGLFKTPWKDTEKAIKTVGEKSSLNIKWIVWEL